jgi:hypothetical protein
MEERLDSTRSASTIYYNWPQRFPKHLPFDSGSSWTTLSSTEVFFSLSMFELMNFPAGPRWGSYTSFCSLESNTIMYQKLSRETHLMRSSTVLRCSVISCGRCPLVTTPPPATPQRRYTRPTLNGNIAVWPVNEFDYRG